MTTVKLIDTIPLFPLHKTILLPGSVLPLHIFESRYRQMVEHVQLWMNAFQTAVFFLESLSLERMEKCVI